MGQYKEDIEERAEEETEEAVLKDGA